MKHIPLDICVDTIEGAHIAADNGADRIELCAALSEDGLTPPVALMEAVARLPVPAMAMMRPRGGGFVFSPEEKAMMLRDAEAAAGAGMAGIVVGVLTPDRRLDRAFLAELVGRAGLPATLHRAFDVIPDFRQGVADAIEAGIARILTSGQAPSVPEGMARLTETVAAAAGKISIMAGAGIEPDNVVDIVRATGVDEVHASCHRMVPPGAGDGPELALGFVPPAGLRAVDPACVAGLRRALDEAAQA